MTELTRRCLSLSIHDREFLIKTLIDSINDEKEDNGRFATILKCATEIVGDGILTKSRDHHCVVGRMLVAWQMRKEGYSIVAIGRRLQKHHATIVYLLKLMDDVFSFPGCFKLEETYWSEFQRKLKEYDTDRRTTQDS